MAASQTPQELARQTFFTLTVRQLRRLCRFVRRQIAAYETAGG